MAYPHKWSPISYKSSSGQRKHIGQTPVLYRWTTPPTTRCQLQSVPVCLHRKEYRSVTALLEAVRCFCRCRLVCCVRHSEPLDRPTARAPAHWLRLELQDRRYPGSGLTSAVVKLGNHRSPVICLNVGIPQGFVMRPFLLAKHDVIRYHQYADDALLHLAMPADNTAAGQSVHTLPTADSGTCTTACN